MLDREIIIEDCILESNGAGIHISDYYYSTYFTVINVVRNIIRGN